MNIDFGKHPVIPVVKISDAKKAPALARALLDGGIGIMEITLRTEAGLGAIALASEEVPEMCTGAGSVMDAESARTAIAAGAKFVVSPGFDAGTLEVCREKDIPYVPGCATATEVQNAWNHGLRLVKYFPAKMLGGVKMLEALSAPFPGMLFMPTGGIDEGNIGSYLRLECVPGAGGSAVAPASVIDAGGFERVTFNAKRYVAAAERALNAGNDSLPDESVWQGGLRRNPVKNRNVRFASLGELMMRLTPPDRELLNGAESFDVFFGGAEANVAISLACMGVPSSFISKFPEGDIGDAAIGTLRRYGVDTSTVLRGGNRLGIYYLEKGAGERPPKVIYDRTGSAISEADPAEFDFAELFKDTGWFHMTGITPALSENTLKLARKALREAQRRGITVSFDLNFRKKLWDVDNASDVLNELLPAVDVLIANEEHADKICGVRCEDDLALTAEGLCRKYGFKAAAVTRRRTISSEHHSISAGAYIDGERVYSPVRECEDIVDRTGGGDAFAAGFIYSLMHGSKPEKAIRYASAASALKHTIEGDFSTAKPFEIERMAY
ncbi:MAG: bifunctional 4-hydroxy-2-oxoglutarate aldolase/2-dehydro-3-deoxy-phosphogluconate aldolase [Clostridia bacterium]|nr:bifunctional 4-hydroxy-2-oxoglutarate aldolase/2-dehydro-3-deoxy-phosphogluconate aldolase [Clostridia bacterium]